MKILSLFSFTIFLILSLFQTEVVGGNSAWASRGKNKELTNGIATEFPPSPELPIKATKCPALSLISPCTCSIPPLLGGVFVTCASSAVNQTSIENAFAQLRQANEIPSDRVIHIRQFTLDSTNLTELNLAPFYGAKMDFLFIQFNFGLTKLATSGNPQDLQSIHATSLNLQSSPLKRQGFGDALKYFSNELSRFSARDLQLNQKEKNYLNQDEDEDDSELLPGLSTHKKLEQLRLSNCNLGQLNLENWKFREMSSIIHITLDEDNITTIGENVFRLDALDTGELGYLHIDLANNKLNETSFHPNSGIAQTPTDRRTSLYLKNNQITTLPALIFEPFLDAKIDNSIELEGNRLICDERLSWIKARRGEFQFLVKDANCINDPGHTIFDSDLIP